MLEELGKNIIFLVTPDADDRLAVWAYDFYSFVKLSIIFHDNKYEKEEEPSSLSYEPDKENELESGDLKQQLEYAYDLIEQSAEEKNKANYDKSERLLLKALDIKEKILGTEHLEMADVYNELACIYERQGKNREALKLYNKSLYISERMLGEEHPDTATVYNNLAGVYISLWDYKKA